MGTPQLREKLHQFIDETDDRMLRLIYGMMKADAEEDDYLLTEAHKEILDQRLEAHEADPSQGSEWTEVKKRIRKK
jgi:putative addiction module component (TIGR02574 family)